jgi:hypothetical protein
MYLRAKIGVICLFAMWASDSRVFGQTPGRPQAPTCSPPDVKFGSRDVGTRTAPVEVTVNNETGSPLRFTAQTTTPDFTVERNACRKDLHSGRSCAIAVSFSPILTGDRQGELQIKYQGVEAGKASAPLKVPLSGTGQVAELSVSPAQVSFPPQRVGTRSAPRTVVLASKKAKINGIVPSGDFLLEAPKFPVTLEPDKPLAVLVRFKPRHRGSASGALTILSTSSENPQSVQLSGSTPCFLEELKPGTDVALAIVICILYWLAMVIVRWHRIAMRARWLLREQILSVKEELNALPVKAEVRALPGGDQAELRAAVCRLLERAQNLIDGPQDQSGSRWANLLFWSRGQEITGWGYVHEAQVRMVPLLPYPTVRARLESAEEQLRLATDAPCRALADEIHRERTSKPHVHFDRLKALLAEALAANYDREDNTFSDLVSWQNKTSWLVGCGLGLILLLTIAFPEHSVLLLVGGAGGLISRLSRSLDRKDVPSDYGASWTTLFLSPVSGALGAWAGILLADLAIKTNVLGSAFAVDWNHPTGPATLAVALVFGFSERLLDSVFDKLEGKALAGQTGAAGAPKPGLAISDPKLPEGKAGKPYGPQQLKATGATGNVKWSVAQGSTPPPAGVQVDPSGKISGTPTTQGEYKFTVEAADDTSKASRELTLKINP